MKRIITPLIIFRLFAIKNGEVESVVVLGILKLISFRIISAYSQKAISLLFETEKHTIANSTNG